MKNLTIKLDDEAEQIIDHVEKEYPHANVDRTINDVIKESIKKLTLRLDKDNVDLLNKLEKRFPSLSQNQILNHVITYGAAKMLDVVGEEVPTSSGTGNGGSVSITAGTAIASTPKSALMIQGDSLIFVNSKGEKFSLV